jgi:hypothetical protein
MSLLAVVGTTAQASNVEGNAEYKQGTRNKEFRTKNAEFKCELINQI